MHEKHLGKSDIFSKVSGHFLHSFAGVFLAFCLSKSSARFLYMSGLQQESVQIVNHFCGAIHKYFFVLYFLNPT